MKKVQMFQALDDTYHDTEEECIKHEHAIYFRNWCESNICCGGDWSWEMVYGAITEYWEVTPKETA